MKVYQINSVCGYGSTGKIVKDLADILNAKGHQCRIGYGRGVSDDPRAFCFSSDLQIKLHGVLSRITDRQGFYSAGATKRLIADIKSFAPDIIHLHNIHGYYLHTPSNHAASKLQAFRILSEKKTSWECANNNHEYYAGE